MSIRNEVIELEGIKIELKSLGARSKILRKRKKEIQLKS